MAPSWDARDLYADRQLASRDYWVDVEGIDHPGPFAKLSATPIVYRSRAPHLGEHQALVDDTTRRPSVSAPATMPATTLGTDMDPEKAWGEREQAFKLEKSFLKTRNVVQSAEGHNKGQWSTVVALGVFIF